MSGLWKKSFHRYGPAKATASETSNPIHRRQVNFFIDHLVCLQLMLLNVQMAFGGNQVPYPG